MVPFYAGGKTSGGEVYRDVLAYTGEQTRLAEEAGFHAVWLGEHHLGAEGFDVHPNPVITGTYLATQTSRIRIGFAAAIIPSWHPLRFAEDVAMLDHLSNGRVECGVGRGISARELSNLNVLDPDRHRDEERNWGIFLETLEIIKQAWTEDPFSFDGEYYTFPRPNVKVSYTLPQYLNDAGELTGLSVQPKPLQVPYPPLWNVVDQTPGFIIAAEHDLKPITAFRSRAGLYEAFETYRTAASRAQGRELKLGENCGLLRLCLVAETDEEAQSLAAPGVNGVFKGIVRVRTRDMWADPGETLTDRDLTSSWFDFLTSREQLLVGSPETVTEGIQTLKRDYGVDTLLLWMWMPDIESRHVLRSLELFAEEVMPHIGEARTPGGLVTDGPQV